MNALVLEGGGIKGAYQIGAYYAMLECGIKIDGFYGTSIGAFNAAVLCANKHEELLHFWLTTSPGELFGFEKGMIDGINLERYDVHFLTSVANSLSKTIANHGIDTAPMLSLFDSIVTEEEIRTSGKDFGLVTVKVPALKSIEIYKDEIPEGKIKEYVMASCYLPIFKLEPIIDDNYYVDGGFHDGCPVNMALEKDYDTIYVIRIRGFSMNRKLKDKPVKIVTIKPKRRNGRILELKHKTILENVRMGYYDALRVLKGYDGDNYVFEYEKDKYYASLIKKMKPTLLSRIKAFFYTEDNKFAIIKAVEYIMEREGYTYYDIYSLPKVIKKIRKINKKHVTYQFVSKLRIWW